MNVLIVVENMSVPRDRRVWQEALTLRRAGHRVSVVCPVGPGEPSYEEIDGVAIHRHPLEPSPGGVLGYVREYAQALSREWSLARAIDREQPVDVVHVCNPPDLLFLVALYLRWRRGSAMVFDHHDLAPELFAVKFGRKGLLFRSLRLLERLTFRAADVVLSANRSYQAIARERGGVPADRSFIVRSAPDLERFPAPAAAPEPAEAGELRVGYVGVLGEQDGVDILLRAARHLADGPFGDRVRVRVIGDGPAMDSLRRLTEELGVGRQVEFTGWLSGADLIDALAGCDVCACPDPPNEFTDRSTMIKVMEYMAMGKPVIQFESTEGRRTAEDAALYAAPGDTMDFARQIERLLGSPELRGRLGVRGRRRMERELSWDHQVPSLYAAYDKVAEILEGRREGSG